MTLQVSSSPHIRDNTTTSRIMLDVIIALIPALIASVIIFGYRTLLVTGVTVLSCVAFEFISRKVMKREQTIGDLSAIVTGMLLAFNLPYRIPLWIPVVGAFFAIVIVKQMFGGIGENFANPAVVARIILLLSFPEQMTDFSTLSAQAGKSASGAYEMVSSATPLDLLRKGAEELPGYMDLFLGLNIGTIGEVSALALIIGAVYLLVRRVIDISIPGSFILTTAVFVALNGQDPIYHILSGGLLLGAFFMATDYVTSPITAKGKIIFGIGCGLITGLLRVYGSMNEGVSYAILLMNILTPYINNWTRPVPVGGVKRAAAKG